MLFKMEGVYYEFESETICERFEQSFVGRVDQKKIDSIIFKKEKEGYYGRKI